MCLRGLFVYKYSVKGKSLLVLKFLRLLDPLILIVGIYPSVSTPCEPVPGVGSMTCYVNLSLRIVCRQGTPLLSNPVCMSQD